ncbi:hypothetical protein V6N13_045334 [Hibiscus sabdariffa]
MATKAADDDAVAVGGVLKYKFTLSSLFYYRHGFSKSSSTVKAERRKSRKFFKPLMIDSQQHKVTVTSSVDAETLIKKLTKSGKHVQIWPEKKEKKPRETNGFHNPKDVGAEAGADGNHDPKNNNSAEKPKPAAAASKGSAGDNQHPEGDQMGGKSQEPDPTQSTSGASNGGNKKKKKKGQNGNPIGPNPETPSGGDTQSLLVPDHARPEASIDLSPPNQPMYPYTPLLYGSPFCGVSYNTTCPSSTSSYYAPTMHFMPPAPPSVPNDNSGEDYYHDDDESGCSIM